MSESDASSPSTVNTSQCSPLSSIASSPAPSPASSPTIVLAKSPINKDLAVKRPTRPILAHPSTAVMVTTAIKSLNDKKGSTLPAIKKYLAVNYQVDSAKFAPYIRRFLKSAIAKGKLIQTNGTGATGNFKLPATEKKPVANKKVGVSAIVKDKKPQVKKPIAKKPTTATSRKRRSIEGTTTSSTTSTTISNAKKPKNVLTATVKPKTKKTVEVTSATSSVKTKNSKSAAKRTPTKKTAPKKNKNKC